MGALQHERQVEQVTRTHALGAALTTENVQNVAPPSVARAVALHPGEPYDSCLWVGRGTTLCICGGLSVDDRWITAKLSTVVHRWCGRTCSLGPYRGLVQQFWPTPLNDVDPIALVAADPRPTPVDRPWLVVNMVASIDGAIEVEGRSGGLSSPADKAMFHALRELPDVIMVGAGTARAENYGPVQLDEAAQARRIARGQQPVPRLAVVSGRANLDPTSRLFCDPRQPPIVITSKSAPAEALDPLRDVSDILIVGDATVDLRAALRHLRHDGVNTALCEGGPTLNDQLLAEDLVDEWCQTISPILTGGAAARGAHGDSNGVATRLVLERVIVDDSVLLLRYARES